MGKIRLTPRQKDALRWLSDRERPTAFGSGFGAYRIALRALHYRAPGLTIYHRAEDGTEYFQITDAGREALKAIP